MIDIKMLHELYIPGIPRMQSTKDCVTLHAGCRTVHSKMCSCSSTEWTDGPLVSSTQQHEVEYEYN